MKRTIKSVSDFAEYINQNLKTKSRIPKVYGKYMAQYVSTFTVIMKTSRGRDKICSIFQYMAQFYYACNKYSNIEEVRQRAQEGLSQSIKVAYKIKASMKNARKIFKFLKFIDQILALYKLSESKKVRYMIILKFLIHLVSFFHNLIDNFLMTYNIGIFSKITQNNSYKRWKAKKHITSLLRIILKATYYNFAFQIRNKEMKNILLQLKPYQKKIIKEDHPSLELCQKYLKQRNEIRFQILDSVIMAFRLVMLIKRLKLPGTKYVSSILYAFCGVISTILSTVKMLIEKPVLLQIKNRGQQMKSVKSFTNTENIIEQQPTTRIKLSQSKSVIISQDGEEEQKSVRNHKKRQ